MRSTLCTVLQPNKMFGCNTVLDYEMMVTILLASIYNSSLRSIIFGDIRNCYFPARLAFDASGKWYVTPIVSHVGKIYGNVFDFFFLFNQYFSSYLCCLMLLLCLTVFCSGKISKSQHYSRLL